MKPLFLLWVGKTGRFNEKSVRVTGNLRKIRNRQRQNVDYRFTLHCSEIFIYVMSFVIKVFRSSDEFSCIAC